jgi:hypothetical protein
VKVTDLSGAIERLRMLSKSPKGDEHVGGLNKLKADLVVVLDHMDWLSRERESLLNSLPYDD